MLAGEPQLPEPSEGVLQRPGMHDPAVVEAEESYGEQQAHTMAWGSAYRIWVAALRAR